VYSTFWCRVQSGQGGKGICSVRGGRSEQAEKVRAAASMAIHFGLSIIVYISDHEIRLEPAESNGGQSPFPPLWISIDAEPFDLDGYIPGTIKRDVGSVKFFHGSPPIAERQVYTQSPRTIKTYRDCPSYPLE